MHGHNYLIELLSANIHVIILVIEDMYLFRIDKEFTLEWVMHVLCLVISANLGWF